MESSNLGKWIIFVGLGLIAIGLLIWLGAKFGIPFGKLPGDIYTQTTSKVGQWTGLKAAENRRPQAS